MSDQPHECVDSHQEGERLSKAYWEVMSELQGEGIDPDLLTAMKPGYIEAFHDGKAGRFLADYLDGIRWDWPRWNAFAKRNGYSMVSEMQPIAVDQHLHTLLFGALKADLITLGTSLGISLPKSATKAMMVKLLLEIPVERFDAWVTVAKENRPTTELQRLHRTIGTFVHSRISRLALSQYEYEQRSDPGVMQLHPYWRFICPEDQYPVAPKKCRDMNQKVLLAAQAMKEFPKLPCSRIDCNCRMTTQRRVDG